MTVTLIVGFIIGYLVHAIKSAREIRRLKEVIHRSGLVAYMDPRDGFAWGMNRIEKFKRDKGLE